MCTLGKEHTSMKEHDSIGRYKHDNEYLCTIAYNVLVEASVVEARARAYDKSQYVRSYKQNDCMWSWYLTNGTNRTIV